MYRRFQTRSASLRARETDRLSPSDMRRRTVLPALAALVAGLAVLGDVLLLPHSSSTASAPRQTAVNQTFSERAVSNITERAIVDTLTAAAPQVDELYIQRQRDGGLALFATASLRGYGATYAVAAGIAAQYLVAAFRQLHPYAKVDFADIYIESDGHYIFAAGLGHTAMDKLATQVFASDQGALLTADLARLDHYTGPLVDQAYAQYKAP